MDKQVKLTEDSPRLTSLDELVGKTVARCVSSSMMDRLIIVFADGSYVIFRSESCYGDLLTPTIETSHPLEDDEKESIGMISREECARRKQAAAEKVATWLQHDERQTYERLKAKFEHGDSCDATD